MMKRFVMFAAAAALAACSPGNLSGTVRGQKLDVKEAIFGEISGTFGTEAVVVLSDQPNRCANFKINNVAPNETMLQIGLARLDSKGVASAPTPGPYTFVNSGTSDVTSAAFGYFLKFDAQCAPVSDADTVASSGSVTLKTFNSASNGSATADFTVGFEDNGDSNTGSFNATYCDFSGVSITSDATPTCKS